MCSRPAQTDCISMGINDFCLRTSFWCSVSGCLNSLLPLAGLGFLLEDASSLSFSVGVLNLLSRLQLEFCLDILTKSLSGIWSMSTLRSSLRLECCLSDLGDDLFVFDEFGVVLSWVTLDAEAELKFVLIVFRNEFPAGENTKFAVIVVVLNKIK